MPPTTEPTRSLIDIHIHTIITTIQTAVDIINLVCASIALWYFTTPQIVAFFVLRARAHDERPDSKVQRISARRLSCATPSSRIARSTTKATPQKRLLPERSNDFKMKFSIYSQSTNLSIRKISLRQNSTQFNQNHLKDSSPSAGIVPPTQMLLLHSYKTLHPSSQIELWSN